MGNLSRTALFPGILIAWLWCASPAAADIIDFGSFILDDTANDLPAIDLAGWFLTLDPSNEWTSQSNIETMQSWLAVAEEIAANPFVYEELRAYWTSELLPPVSWQWAATSVSQQQGLAPEPATLGLLGGSLALLGLYVLRRARRQDNNSTYVSLPRTD